MADLMDLKVAMRAPLPSKYMMSISGSSVDGDAKSFDVINPATGESFAKCPSASKEQLDAAAAAAARALITWGSMPETTRKHYLAQVQEALSDVKTVHLLAKVLCLEQGKPMQAALEEVLGCPFWVEAFSAFSVPEPKVVQEDETTRAEVHHRPVGVVCAITPWNFPLGLAQWKILPALVAGCTVVLKPSPYTPLSTLLLGQIYNSILPPGVVNVVTGGNDLGQWMTTHPTFAKVSFTGSTATGKKIREVCAGSLKRLTLELGGNDAAIVLPGTNAKDVAPGLFGCSMANSGQVCAAIKRVYVHEDDHDALVKEMTALAREAKFGPGMEDGVMFGPLCNKMQFDKVSSMVEDARLNGAVINSGGERVGSKGFVYAPTIISGVDESFRIVSEEQFGPAIPICKYSTVEEAVHRANNTTFGLGGSVWGADTSAASAVAAQLQCGTAWVNQHIVLSQFTPFGGFKESGLGRELGADTALLPFLECQTLNVATQASAPWASKL